MESEHRSRIGATTHYNHSPHEDRSSTYYILIANRNPATKVAQLRTGHCGLNGYLHCFGIKNTLPDGVSKPQRTKGKSPEEKSDQGRPDWKDYYETQR